jgi:hypothetical protein
MFDRHKRSAMRQGCTKKFQKKRSIHQYVSTFLKLFRATLAIDERFTQAILAFAFGALRAKRQSCRFVLERAEITL